MESNIKRIKEIEGLLRGTPAKLKIVKTQASKVIDAVVKYDRTDTNTINETVQYINSIEDATTKALLKEYFHQYYEEVVRDRYEERIINALIQLKLKLGLEVEELQEN